MIVGATAVIAVLQANRVSNVSKERAALEEEAPSLGIVLDGSGPSKSDATESATSPGGEGGGSPDPKAEVATSAKELIELAKRMKEIEKSGKISSRKYKAARDAFLDRLLALEVDALPFLVDEIRASDELDEEAKRDLLNFAMTSLAQSDPQKALELFLSSTDLFGGGGRPHGIVEGALGGWTQKDPGAALTWLEDHAGELPEHTVSHWRSHTIAQAFATDPDFAVGKALELERGQVMGLGDPLAKVGKTPQDQLGILRRVEDRLEALPADPSAMAKFSETASTEQFLRVSLLNGLGHRLTQGSFESSQEFLESANLEPTELAVVAYGAFEGVLFVKDPQPWLPWIHESSAENARDSLLSGIVGNWARNDHRATAEWILEQPQGALRERATYGFADAVSDTEPDSAAEWALTLPASERRTQLLQKIHQNWQSRDADAAAAFARENGLEVE